MSQRRKGPNDEDGDADVTRFHVLSAAFGRWEHEPPISLRVQREEAWYLMSALQGLCGSSGLDLDDRCRSMVEGLGRQIQRALVDVPELLPIVEGGWSR